MGLLAVWLDESEWMIIGQLIELDGSDRNVTGHILFQFRLLAVSEWFVIGCILIIKKNKFAPMSVWIRRWRWLPFYCPFISMANSYDDRFFHPIVFLLWIPIGYRPFPHVYSLLFQKKKLILFMEVRCVDRFWTTLHFPLILKRFSRLMELFCNFSLPLVF